MSEEKTEEGIIDKAKGFAKEHPVAATAAGVAIVGGVGLGAWLLGKLIKGRLTTKQQDDKKTE